MKEGAVVKRDYGKLSQLVGGHWIESESQQIQPVYDPGTGDQIGLVPFATGDEVDRAVESADETFRSWKDVPIAERLKYLFKMKEVLEAHLEELAMVNTQNHGKTIRESRGDLRRAIDNVEAAIAVARTLAKGEMLPQLAPGIDESMVREPLGVFAIISPFNFPIMIPFWFIPYAVALGDTLVVKPSETDPVPTYRTIQILQEEAALPPGVVNLVNGGGETVKSLLAHRHVKGVTFVGSTAVARAVYKLAGEHGKRALANGGAKNSIVVMPDANLTESVPNMISSFFGNAGQRCLAGSNLVAVGNSHDQLLKRFSLAATELKIGYGLDEESEMGPVVSDSARKRIVSKIEAGISEKAKLVVDGRGRHVESHPRGFYLGATVFDEVTSDMTMTREEIFGPVAAVMTVETIDQAIDMINTKTAYGNMASIYTSSGKSAREFSRNVNAGNIGVNIGVAAPSAAFPFGGRGDSFFGTLHAQSDTLDFFTDKKVTITRW